MWEKESKRLELRMQVSGRGRMSTWRSDLLVDPELELDSMADMDDATAERDWKP